MIRAAADRVDNTPLLRCRTTGHLDLVAYDAYLSGNVVDHQWEDADIQSALADALSGLPTLA